MSLKRRRDSKNNFNYHLVSGVPFSDRYSVSELLLLAAILGTLNLLTVSLTAEGSFGRAATTEFEDDPRFTYQWGNPLNWEPEGGPPGGQDSATVIAARTLVPSMISVKNLTVGGGQSIFGPGPLEVTGNLNLGNCGLLDAPGRQYTNFPTGKFELWMKGDTLVAGTLGVSYKFLNYGNARTFAPIVRAQPPIYRPMDEYVTTWINKPGSELVIEGETYFIYSGYPVIQFATFTNELAATIIKTNTTDARIEWRLHNDGLIHVREGLLWFQNPTRLNGSMEIQEGTTLRFEQYLNETIEVGPLATFSGGGNLIFDGKPTRPLINFTGARVISPAMNTVNVTITGDALTFQRPMTWDAGGSSATVWTGSAPVQFLSGGRGRGIVQRPMINLGAFTDTGISSGPGSSFVNLAPGIYAVTNSAQNLTYGGWFTNSLAASIQFQGDAFTPAPTLAWNLMNQGNIHVQAGAKARMLSEFRQDLTGQITLNSASVTVSNMVLGGRVIGSGSITSYHAQVSAVLSPSSTNGPFGRLELRSVGYLNVSATNRIVLEPSTVFEVDLGQPGTEYDIFDIAAASKSAAPEIAGRINIRARSGFGPGEYPFYQYCCGNTVGHDLRFGDVPPGYRYSLATNTTTRVFSIVVSEPEVQTVALRSDPDGSGFLLEISTLPGLPYSIDFTDELVIQPWQRWTNITGTGQFLSLPVDPGTATRLFRVTEGGQ